MIWKRPDLLLTTPPWRNNVSIKSLSPYISDWKRSKRRVGGCWTGSGELVGSRDFLLDMYFNHIGDGLIETADGVESWRGILSGADMTIGDKIYRRDLLKTSNAVKMLYSLVGLELIINTGAEFDGNWSPMGGGGTGVAERSTDWSAAGSWSWYVETIGPMGGIKLNTSAAVSQGASYAVSAIVNVVGSIPQDSWWVIKVRYEDDDTTACEYQVGPPLGEGVIVLQAEFTADRNTTVEFETWGEDSMQVYIDECHITPVRLPSDTGWLTKPASISEFGRIEEIFLEAEHTEESALGKLRAHLERRGFVDPEVISIDNDSEKLSLRFYACGLAYTLGWKYTNIQGDATISEHLATILSDALYVVPGHIDANTTPYRLDATYPTRQWDAIDSLVQAGDTSGNTWKGGIFTGNDFDYNLITVDYSYTDTWRRINGELINPYHVEPARVQFGAVAADPRLDTAIIDQVETDWNGKVSVTLED